MFFRQQDLIGQMISFHRWKGRTERHVTHY